MSTVTDRREQLKRQPWHLVRMGLRLLRRGHWRQPRPTGEYLLVDADVETLTEALGRRYFYPNWELSAYYDGEILNLSRTLYDPIEDIVWRQAHVRGWPDEDGIALRAHYEADPSEHPTQHLSPGTYADTGRGMEILRAALDDAGLSYQTFQYG